MGPMEYILYNSNKMPQEESKFLKSSYRSL